MRGDHKALNVTGSDSKLIEGHLSRELNAEESQLQNSRNQNMGGGNRKIQFSPIEQKALIKGPTGKENKRGIDIIPKLVKRFQTIHGRNNQVILRS
jgi:hypothetical protein